VAPLANIGQSEDEEGDRSTPLPPILAPLEKQVEAKPLPYTEAILQLQSTLKKTIISSAAAQQCLVAINACAKSTDGKAVLLACMDHTGFDPMDPASMANLKNLELIEATVRTHHGFLKLVDLVFSQTPSISKKGMKIVSTCTGDASDKESSRSHTAREMPKFAMKASRSHDTPKSSTTPAYVGERAAAMDGVVFQLKTNVDNSTGGSICIKTSGVLNRLEDNTLLRFLVEQDRIIDMSK